MFRRVNLNTTVCALLIASIFAGIGQTADARTNSETLRLADKGATNYSIIVAGDAPQPVEQAAQELSHFLNRMTGAEFPIKTDDAPAGEFEIVLGPTNRKSLSDIPAQLRPKAWEGFVVLPEDARLYIIGGRIPRGTLYGAYDFLERELGVRFLAPQVNHVPSKPTLRVRVGSRVFNPPFEYRAHYPPHNPRPGNDDWMTRQRLNSIGVGSGHVRRLGHPVHTFAVLVPSGEYFEEHPEYFALKDDGTRNSGTLCLSNPGTLRVATEKAKQWASQAGSDPGTKYIVQVSQNDSGAYCKCTDCAAADAEDGAPMSGALLQFVNAVAREISDDHPNVHVDTLAYMTSEFAPRKTKAEPNVIIWMAPIIKDSSRPVNEPQVNYSRKALGMELAQKTHEIPDTFKKLETYENLKGWTRASKNVYIWDYPGSFHDFLVPYPSLWPNAENIRIFAETGVTGYFPQQPNTDGSEMRYLRNYVMSRMQWRPDTDYRKDAKEFCRLYYGRRAGAQIFKYVDLLHTSWQREDRPLWWGGFKDDRFVPVANKILAKASRFAETEEHAERVAEFRLPIWRLMITQAFGNAGRIQSLPEKWWYRTDDDQKAIEQRWHDPTDFSGWKSVEIPTRLFTFGGGHGPGWYAVNFDLAESGESLALHFAAMDGVSDVFIDGVQVAAGLPTGLGYYNEVPYVPLGDGLSAGRHTMVVRVKDGSGFYKLLQHENPRFTTADAVTIVNVAEPLSPQLRTAAEQFLSVSRTAGLVRVFYGYVKPDPYLEQLLRPKIEFLLTHGSKE